MVIVEKVKIIDKMLSKYFVLFSIVMFAFVFGWTYTGGGNNLFVIITRY